MLSTSVLLMLTITAVIFMIIGSVVLHDQGSVVSIWEKKIPGSLLVFSGFALALVCIIDIFG